MEGTTKQPDPAEALHRLMIAATDVVNGKLGEEFTGTDFHAALASERATIEMRVILPKGSLQCFVNWAAMSPKPELLFEAYLEGGRCLQ